MSPPSIDIYTQLLIDKIWNWGSIYLDYDFVSEFTRPCCKNIELKIPSPLPTKAEYELAKKFYELRNNNPTVLDDFIEPILSLLLKSWYAESYQYMWWVNPPDTALQNPWFAPISFAELFKLHPDLLRDSASWWTILSQPILQDYFLNENNLLLWVGYWKITISSRAFRWAFVVWDGAIMYEDYQGKCWWEYVYGPHKEKWNIQRKEITWKHSYCTRMRVIFTNASQIDSSPTTIYYTEELADQIKREELDKNLRDFQSSHRYTKDSWIKGLLNNELKVTSRILRELWGIPSRIFSTDKNGVTIKNQVRLYSNGSLDKFTD